MPPSTKRLILTILAAITLAAIGLITVVLPAEYAIDPLGAGHLLGLTKPTATANMLQLVDNLGGNEKVKPTAAGISSKSAKSPDPIILPNRNVQQSEVTSARSEMVKIVIEP